PYRGGDAAASVPLRRGEALRHLDRGVRVDDAAGGGQVTEAHAAVPPAGWDYCLVRVARGLFDDVAPDFGRIELRIVRRDERGEARDHGRGHAGAGEVAIAVVRDGRADRDAGREHVDAAGTVVAERRREPVPPLPRGGAHLDPVPRGVAIQIVAVGEVRRGAEVLAVVAGGVHEQDAALVRVADRRAHRFLVRRPGLAKAHVDD